MFEHLEQIEQHYNEITEELTKPEVLNDIKKTRELSKELSELEDVVSCFKEYKKVLENLEDTKEMLKDPDLGDMAKKNYKY